MPVPTKRVGPWSSAQVRRPKRRAKMAKRGHRSEASAEDDPRPSDYAPDYTIGFLGGSASLASELVKYASLALHHEQANTHQEKELINEQQEQLPALVYKKICNKLWADKN